MFGHCGAAHLCIPINIQKKAKVIRADLLDFAFALDFNFEDIFRFGKISVLVTFQFW